MKPTRRDTPFREAMRSLLVFDGAMGSLLYERGIFVTQNFEQLNVTRPEVVGKIHEDYVAAGAQVKASDPIVFTSAVSQQASGRCPQRNANGFYSAAKLVIPAGETWTYASALEFDAVDAGSR